MVMHPGFFVVSLVVVGLVALFGVVLLPLVCVGVFSYLVGRNGYG